MTFISLDLPDVFSLAFPSSLYFISSLEHAQEVLIIIPKIESFSVKEVVLKMTVVVLSIRKYFEADSISSCIEERAVVDIPIDPDALTRQLGDQIF
jgi:hypothetical protein